LIFDKAIDRPDARGQEKVRQVIEDLAGNKTLVVVEQDTHLLKEITNRTLVQNPDDQITEATVRDEIGFPSPHAAQLAQRLGIQAITVDELITKLSSN
jgi:energy-coupling factor transporter ATP-binding protein EcfA2